jgi:hypothetical protein
LRAGREKRRREESWLFCGARRAILPGTRRERNPKSIAPIAFTWNEEIRNFQFTIRASRGQMSSFLSNIQVIRFLFRVIGQEYPWRASISIRWVIAIPQPVDIHPGSII